VVIIGGGAVGASCLYHLTQAGVSDCVLLEKDELTSGSTWHAAGNIPTYANSWLGMRAGNYAWRLYKELAKDQDAPITYRHTGAFWPAHTTDRIDLFEHLVGVSRSAGFELAMLGPEDMEAMNPYYKSGKSVIGGIHDPYEGDIDPSQLTQALATHARKAGANVERFTRVTGIERLAEKEWHVTTDKGTLTCEYIVNCTGFYGDDIARFTSQFLPIAVLEHQYLVTDPLQALVDNKDLFPLVRDPDIRFYLRREGAGMLFGSYGHPGRLAFKDGNPIDFAHSLFKDSVDDIADLLESAMEHVPILAEAGVQRFVNGPIGYTPDALPLCGPAYGLPNFYHACGIQIGITHSAAVGKAITEWITEGETEWDYSAWDPRRFGDWATKDYAQQRIVELYDLQYAIPFPHRIIQSGRPLLCTPLYSTLINKGAVFGQIGGWERAFWFDRERSANINTLSFRHDEPWRKSVAIECATVAEHVGVMDHGGFTKFEVTGPGAEQWLDTIFCTRLPETGRVRLAYMLTEHGHIWSEATIARLTDNHFLLCGPTLADLRDFDWLQQHLPKDNSVSLTKGSRHDATLMLMGPKSRDLLTHLTTFDLSKDNTPWMSVQSLTIADCPVVAMRVSYVGELGWELHMMTRDLAHVYAEIFRVGEAYQLIDFGSYALNAMRLEKAYHGWGSDFGTEYTMADAGLMRFVDINKPEFIGRDAVLKQQQYDTQWTFIHLHIEDGDADPLPGDPILLDDHCVGYVTSGGTGFRLNKCIALGYINASVSPDVDRFSVQILGRMRDARLVRGAFYDPVNARLKS